MRFRLHIIILSALLAFSCEDYIQFPDAPTPPQTPQSAGETVGNCVLLSHVGVYKYKPSAGGAQVSLVWQTKKGFVTRVGFDNDIIVEVASGGANALLAEKDASGKILRTIHLWYPGFEFSNKYYLNVNLGAVSREGIGSYGLLYQWGRAVPFPGSPVECNGTTSTMPVPVYDIDGNEVQITHSSWTSAADNTLEYALQHPTEVMSCRNTTSKSDWLQVSDDTLWGHIKTAADPCPDGYRVAQASDFRMGSQYLQGTVTDGILVWKTAFGNEERLAIKDVNGDGKIGPADYLNGWTIDVAGGYSFFPAASRYDGQYAMLMGSMVGLWGNWWTCDSADGGNAVAVAFQVKDMSGNELYAFSPKAVAHRADAYSIRCVKI